MRYQALMLFAILALAALTASFLAGVFLHVGMSPQIQGVL
jgi:hypothetical protein